MKKISTKKMLTVLISLAMVFSALAVISMAAEPAYAQTASGQFYASTDPITPITTTPPGTVLTPLASPAPMIFVAEASTNAASFTAGQTVDFYWSTTTAASGIVGGVAGTTTASPTGTISGSFVLTSVPSTPGSYYLVAASEGVLSGGVASSVSTASPATFTVTAQTNYPISLQLSTNGVSYSTNVTGTVTSTIDFEGSGFDSTLPTGLTVGVFTLSGGSPPTTFTVSGLTLSSGEISGTISITANPAGYYYVIAYDGGSGGGFATAQSILGVEPSVSPVISIPAGLTSFTASLTGAGFRASSTFAPSTISAPSNTVTIGGVDAILTGTPTVSSKGAVTFSIAGLVSALSSTGPYTVVINDQQGHSYSFPDQAYVSSPTGVPTLFVTDTTTSSASGNVGDGLSVIAINFGATVTISASIDGTSITLTGSSSGETDANGFAASSSSQVVPTIPGGSYTVYAVDVSGHSASAPFTVLPSLSVTSGSPATSLNGEYAPTTTPVTVLAEGLAANTEYVITDTGLATTSSPSTDNLVASGVAITYTTGSKGANALGVVSDATGTIKISYALDYAGIATGTSESITVGSLPSVSYLAVGKVTISTSATSFLTSTGSSITTASATVSGLVPSGASYASSVVTSGPYNFYIGSTELTFTSGKTSFSVTSTAPVTESFYLPLSVTDGVNTLTVNYGGSSGNILGHDYNFITSTPGSALVSGDVSVNSHLSTGSLTAAYTGDVIAFDVFDAAPSTTVSVVYYNNIGIHTASFTTDANGAATYDFTVPSATAGTYLLKFTQNSVSYTTTYVVNPGLIAFDQAPFADNSYNPLTSESPVTPGSNVTFYAYSLTPDTSYNVYLGSSTSYSSSTYVSSFTTDKYGNGPSSGINVTVPSVTASGSTLDLGIATGTVNTASGTLTTPTLLTITTSTGYQVIYSGLNYSAATVYAFPGQLVTFSIPGGSGTPAYYEVQVTLNGTAYTTVKAYYSSGFISGSFLMPNDAAGSSFTLGLSYAAVTATPTTVVTSIAANEVITTGNSNPSGNTVPIPAASAATYYGTATYTFATPPSGSTISQITSVAVYSVSSTATPSTAYGNVTYFYYNPSTLVLTIKYSVTVPVTTTGSGTATVEFAIDYSLATTATVTVQLVGTFTPTASSTNPTVALVQGNGALLTGISSGQIATITADVTNAVTTSMKVPLSELNASVVAINGAVAKINTAFGNMTATLKSINATVQSISSGQVLVLTKLGSVETSLASLNASLTAFNGNIVTINTTLGQVKTTLAGINAQVTTNGNGIATISTDLGTLSGVVTSTNGNVSTIKTNLGTLTTTVGKINTNTQGFSTLEIFLIVAIVLILITLVIAFLAVSNTNKLSKKFEEQKKQ
jgi:hypothetical protein